MHALYYVGLIALPALGVMKGCLALPTQASSMTQTSHSADTSSIHQEQRGANVPALSHYTVSELKENANGRYEEVHHPQWDLYDFHMIKDHPINAQKYREDLDKDLKEGHIGLEEHEKETNNSKNRERAVKHVLYGGIVRRFDHPKVVVHGDHIKTDTLHELQDYKNFASFHMTREGGQAIFTNTGDHITHEFKERFRQGKRMREINALAQHPGSGKQDDIKVLEPAHTVEQARDRAVTTSPSPPSSPIALPRKKTKDEIFGHKAWQ